MEGMAQPTTLKKGDMVAKADGSQFYTTDKDGSVTTQLYGKVEEVHSKRRNGFLVHGNFYSKDELIPVGALPSEEEVAEAVSAMSLQEVEDMLTGNFGAGKTEACNTKNAPAEEDEELIQGLEHVTDIGLVAGDKVKWRDERTGTDHFGEIERLAVYAWVRDADGSLRQELGGRLQPHWTPEQERRILARVVVDLLDRGGLTNPEAAEEIIDRVIDSMKSGRLG
jgi:hypothetical protein